MNPMMILALALQAGSMIANQRGQNAINEARDKANKEAKRRNEENYRVAEEARKRGTETVENTQASKEQAAQVRTEKYQGAQGSTSSAPNLIDPTHRGSSAVVKESERESATERKNTNEIASARGRVDALGDVFLNTGLTLSGTGRDIRQYGDYSHGWNTRVLPYQLEEAAHQGNDEFMLGDLLSMAAGMAATKGMGAGKGGTGTSGTPMTNSGTFAGGSASIPTVSSGATFSGAPAWGGSGTPWDWNSAWAQWGQIPPGMAGDTSWELWKRSGGAMTPPINPGY